MRIEKNSELQQRVRKCNNQPERINTVTEMKITLERTDNGLVNTEEQMSYLEDRTVEIIQIEQQNEKNNFNK